MLAPTLVWAAGLILLVDGSFVGGGPPGFNVLSNTCNRFQHQAVLKNNSLWMDGGVNTFTNYTISTPYPKDKTGNETIAQNLWSIQVSMSQPWDWQTNISETAYPKSPQGYVQGASAYNKPPQVANAALWQGSLDDSRVWLFGGITSWWNIDWGNFTYPSPSTYSLWSMDSLTQTWTPFNITAQVPERPSDGFTAEVPEKGLAFWINGFLGSGSSTSTQDFGDNVKQFLDGILVFDLNGQTPIVHNISSTSNPWGDPRVSGQLEYVPIYGHDGVLAMLGGGSKSINNLDKDDTGDYVDMSEIWIWDLNRWNTSDTNSAWYSQKATGDIPGPRADSCSVGFAAPDNSSYQIYVHGGRYGDSFYDDLYVLSLPGFQWTRVYEDNNFKFGHTCHKVGGDQILRTGGINTWSVGGGSDCQNETRAVSVLNIRHPEFRWQTTFNQTGASYRVPQYVSSAIGGNATGGATVAAPVAGWVSDDLRKVFAREVIPPSNKGLSGGAIAGIVVGVLAAVAILAALVFFFWIKKRRSQNSMASQSSEPQELGTDGQQHSPSADSAPPVIEKDASEIYRYEKDGSVDPKFGASTTTPVTEMPAGEHEIRYELDGSGTK